MAHINYWNQGSTPFTYPRCDGSHIPTCPSSQTIAAEYQRGFNTLTNVLNPYVSADRRDNNYPVIKMLEKIEVGDVIWLVSVPPKFTIYDIFSVIEPTLVDGSSMTSAAGLSYTIVAGTFKGKNSNGECEVESESDVFTITVPDPVDDTVRNGILHVKTNGDHDENYDLGAWTGIGIKIVSLPTGKKLSDITVKIGVGVHAIGNETQDFM